jgi:hypothetical protein
MEASDPMDMLASSRSWADLMQIEIHPVVETEQALKLLSRR